MTPDELVDALAQYLCCKGKKCVMEEMGCCLKFIKQSDAEAAMTFFREVMREDKKQ